MAAWRGLVKVWSRQRCDHSLNPQKYFILLRRTSSFSLTKAGMTEEKAALTKQLAGWLKQYEDFVGLTEVRDSQNQVIQAQKKFNEAQEVRRSRQRELLQVQQQLKEIHLELDRTSRGEDRYLQLVTDEHAIIKREKQLIDEFNLLEKEERDHFSAMSTFVRESHEKERAHAERTKYWSVIGSICGAVIGIVGTTINNWLRMRELRGLVHESVSPTILQNLINELSETAKGQHNQITLFIADLKAMLSNEDTTPLKASIFTSSAGKVMDSLPTEKLEAKTNEILTLVKKQESSLSTEMKDIKALIAANQFGSDDGKDHDGAAIYIGRDVERLMRDAEQNLEWKMKISALATVAAIYGALAIALPLIFKAFGGA